MPTDNLFKRVSKVIGAEEFSEFVYEYVVRILLVVVYMFTDETERIKFVSDECVVDQVVDWFGKNITLNARGNGKYEAVVSASPNAMEYWAMQYLNYVEIKTPVELRERIKNNLHKAEEKYK